MDQHHPLERGTNGLNFDTYSHTISVQEVAVEDSSRLQNVDQQIQNPTIHGFDKGTFVWRVYIRSVRDTSYDWVSGAGVRIVEVTQSLTGHAAGSHNHPHLPGLGRSH